eukprot:Protomagalhaensia_sp_Gyna_25__5219@NODE_630_length_2964_cov_360_923077_g489_i0_p1_GENE_NODE_630_length_2964_cov_360_923077_g489_i0NODE_630_length_2964_cov_360_923077_g489_i0_p1_ORF_typecomplete_len514_score101_80Nucleoporin_FG/PF13634_6/8_3e02Nucleoporin_FG/PF13634_6/24Nucleoporin_FG/PF13634_6/71_NODE_630_length_2964_cov_360_923077_g489_i07392280
MFGKTAPGDASSSLFGSGFGVQSSSLSEVAKDVGQQNQVNVAGSEKQPTVTVSPPDPAIEPTSMPATQVTMERESPQIPSKESPDQPAGTPSVIATNEPVSLFGPKPPTTTPLFGTDQSVASGSLFGSDKPPTSPFGGNKPAGSLFGGNKPPTSSFGGNKPAESLFGGDKPVASLFGGDKPAASLLAGDKPASSLFGGTKPASSLFGGDKPASSLFGGDKPASSLFGGDKPAGSLFGGDKPAQASFLFGGANPPEPKPASSLLGAPTSSPFGTDAKPLFGAPSPAATEVSPQPSLFGVSGVAHPSLFEEAAKPAATFGGAGLFGNQPQQANAAGGLFDQSKPPSALVSPSGSGLFGQAVPAVSQQSLFGTTSSASVLFGAGAQQPSPLFGQPEGSKQAQPQLQQPASGLFGSQPQPFGAPSSQSQPQQQPAFGVASSQPQLFGSQPSLFPAASPTASGTFQTPTSPTTLFGGSQPVATSSQEQPAADGVGGNVFAAGAGMKPVRYRIRRKLQQ